MQLVAKPGRVQRVAGFLALALMLAGIIYLIFLGSGERIFISSEARFPEVDLACVHAAIMTTPGVGTVDHYSRPSEAPTVASGSDKVAARRYAWLFSWDEPAAVGLEHDGQSWRLDTYFMIWGTPWAFTEVEKASPEMARVHAAISRKCKLPPLKVSSVMRD